MYGMSEWYVGCLDLKGKSELVKLGWVMSGHAKSRQVRSSQVLSSQVRTGQVRTYQVRTGHVEPVMSGHVKSG